MRPESWTFQWYTHWVRGDSTALLAIPEVFGDISSPERDLANIMWSSCEAHNNLVGHQPDFLPWHRAVLYFFEQIVRKVSGRDEFTLPYWDITSDEALPEPFRNKGHSVFGSLYKEERNPGVNDGAPVRRRSISLNDMRQPTYLAFNAQLDGGLHGGVHVAVGTTMNMGDVPWAANDPIFWLHHCNIDRIWASWNDVGGQNPTDLAWTGRTHIFANSNGVRDQLTNGEVTTTEQLGYVYAELAIPPAPAAATQPLVGQAIQEVIAQSDVAVELGTASTTATLTVVSPAAAAALSSDAPQRLLLVLNGIAAEQPPGAGYDIFIAAQGSPPEEGIYVGSVNFFDAVPLAGNQRSRRRVLDITEALAESAVNAADVDALTYHFIPDAEVASRANPRIARVEIVREVSE